MKLTEAQFSKYCSFIARSAACWSADILDTSDLTREADAVTVARFTDEIRERLKRLDDRAGLSAALSVQPAAAVVGEPSSDRAASEGWQPIETAPKDGREILIAIGGVVRTAWWGDAEYCRSAKTYNRGWTNGPSHGFRPSHWQPLPSAPAIAEAKGSGQ